ncbi:MAG: hypothetical protein F9K46_07365 [Anaerolineae bacterium]|nr:MAG: hypothetical protein F9K46_07365 [Anaerolineae bacterium]
MLRLFQILLAWMVAVFILNGVVLAAVRAIAQNTQPLPETYLDPGECPQPCWQGIQPGTGLERYFFSVLERINLRYSGTTRSNGEVLTEFELTMRGDIVLADVFAAMGQPSHAVLQYVAGTTGANPTERQLLVGGTLYFGNGLVQVDVVRENQDWIFSPDMVVRRIRYFAPNPEGSAVPIGTPRWHGFGRDYGPPAR